MEFRSTRAICLYPLEFSDFQASINGSKGLYELKFPSDNGQQEQKFHAARCCCQFSTNMSGQVR